MIPKICVLFCFLLLSSLANAADEKAPQNNASAAKVDFLQARVGKANFAGGEPVILTITLLNKSAKTASFLMLGPKIEFEIRREGKKVIASYKGKDESKGDKVAYRSVATGEKWEYKVVISRLFDLSRAGNYEIVCKKHVKNENREPGNDLVGPLIVSQKLTFAVSEVDVGENF